MTSGSAPTRRMNSVMASQLAAFKSAANASRGVNMLKKLRDDILLLMNKIRFIKAVVSEEIVVYKMKKSELEKRLESDQYLLHDDKYDYLLRIPIYNLTIDKVLELEHEHKLSNDEITRITDLDIKVWWLEDLDNFMKEYDKSEPQDKEKTKKKIAIKK